MGLQIILLWQHCLSAVIAAWGVWMVAAFFWGCEERSGERISTNAVEGLFARMKRMLRKYRAAPRLSTHYGIFLAEFVWRTRFARGVFWRRTAFWQLLKAPLLLPLSRFLFTCRQVLVRQCLYNCMWPKSRFSLIVHPTCRPTGRSAVSCTVHSSMRQAFRVETPSAEHMSFPDLEAEFTQLKESLDWK